MCVVGGSLMERMKEIILLGKSLILKADFGYFFQWKEFGRGN